MAIAKLHQGVLIRQVLKGKKKVRLAFVPDDTSKPTEEVIRINDDGEKRSWKHLLGGPQDLDIDTGILALRFNTDNMSGIAFFMPAKTKSATITNVFHQTGTPGEGPTAGLHKFNDCVVEKRNTATAIHIPFDLWGAVSECAPLLRQPE